MPMVCHITTADLLDLQNDLLNSRFPNQHWQRGIAGIITGDELPCTFSSTESELQLNHYDSQTQQVTDQTYYPMPVLNIPGVGFFRVTTITNNQSAIIDYCSREYAALVGWLTQEDAEYVDVEAATGLQWSLGGWEEKIAQAYVDVCQQLKSRNVNPAVFDETDAAYSWALKHRALALIYRSLIHDQTDVATYLYSEHNREYERYLSTMTADLSGYVAPATRKLKRGD